MTMRQVVKQMIRIDPIRTDGGHIPIDGTRPSNNLLLDSASVTVRVHMINGEHFESCGRIVHFKVMSYRLH